MKESIGKLYFFKFIYLFKSNFKRFLVINFIALLPVFAIFYGAINIFPYLVDYFNSLNIAVLEVLPEYDKFIIVAIDKLDSKDPPDDAGTGVAYLYVFKKDVFNRIRRYVFTNPYDSSVIGLLRSKAIGTAVVPFYGESVIIKDKNGKAFATIWIDRLQKGSIEIINYKKQREWSQRNFIYYTFLFLSGLIILGGLVGGIGEFVQRMVYHEVQKFSYIFAAITKNFFKSLVVFLFFFIISSAVFANIYFYIFIVSNEISVFVAAMNIWMFIFFLFILQWVLPLMVINSDESIWRTMKKSLFFSFDNFEFSMKVLVNIMFMFVISILTLSLIPGISGILAFLSNSLKEVSVKYSLQDTA